MKYFVVDSEGERVASTDELEDALAMLRLLPSARQVLRASDLELLAFRRVSGTTGRMSGAA